MVGITSFGAYVPFYRLSRDELARAWQTNSGSGQKAIAGYDEDTVTMAVASGLQCLKGFDSQQVDGVFVATASSPYREKQIATIVATALDCAGAAHTADITNSLRSGTTAMHFALNAVESKQARNVLVTASDCRLGAPKSDFESLLGDGSAAVLIGDSDVVAEVEGSYSMSNELLDVWRSDKDTYVRAWEDRFVISEGFTKVVTQVVQGLLKKHDLTPKNFAKVILYAPTVRSHTALAKSLGFDPKSQLQDSLITAIGHTGTASVLLMLAAALEEAKPGDRLLVASYGDGSDAYILRVTEAIEKLRDGRGVKKYLQSQTIPINYEKFLFWRGQIPVDPVRRLDPLVPSSSALYRERKRILALYGQKCLNCGNVQYPPERTCVNCLHQDQFEDYKFADKKGTVFTFSKDYVTAPIEPPKIGCVIDFEGGGRMDAELTDREPDEIKIGLPVEMTFRKLQDFKGVHHYFWKCKPVREGV